MSAEFPRLMVTLVMAGAGGLMGMDAFCLPLLWLYSVCAIVASGIGALPRLAMFATPGGGHAVPRRDGGADVRRYGPLKGLPVCYHFLAEFAPLRQITDGTRSILYNGAQGTRSWPGLREHGRRPHRGRPLQLRGDGLPRPPRGTTRARPDDA
jgi:hypothetical protein